MLDIEDFRSILRFAPLVSIDFIIKNGKNEVLLGKRVNEPAKDFLFTIGGRIYKNETMKQAKYRILEEELNLKLNENELKFIGVFEHFYDNSFVSEDISTHYVNFAYEINISSLDNLPKTQHNAYVWLNIDELLNSNEVHQYVKNYF